MIQLVRSIHLARPEQLAIAAGLLGLGIWLQYVLSVWIESLRSRKEISRYGMFAARDRLVRLVLDGEMSQADPAWRATYASVTELLKMHQRLHVVDVFSRFARYTVAVLTNPALRAHMNRLDGQMKRAVKSSPGFAAVQRDIQAAFHRMVEMRTSFIHVMALRAYVACVNLRLMIKPVKVIFAEPDVGRSEIRRTQRRVSGDVSRALKPTSTDIAGFSAACVA